MFIINSFKYLNKTVKHFINPNQNPTDADREAFKLLQNIEVQKFVQFVKQKQVNVNAVTFNGLSMLTKAVEISNREPRAGLTKQDILSRSIIAVNFLLECGVNIDHQDKIGRTALLAACHWQQQQIVQLLVKHGANLDMQTNQSGWITNPLIAACFKQNFHIVSILVQNGANIDLAIELNKQQNGFRITEQYIDYLMKAKNIKKILLAKKYEELSQRKEKLISKLSQGLLFDIIQIC